MTVYQRVTERELYRFTEQVLAAAGAPAENAAIIADNLVQGELHGLGSHGPSRLLVIYAQRVMAGGVNPRPSITVVRRAKTTALIDGDDGPGAVVGQYAMRMALDMAKEFGSGWVAARNSQHYGAAFLFAREALPLGMIGFSTTAAVPTVSAYGSRSKTLGTNPLCIAVPASKYGSVILDMATSTVARGKIQLYALEGKPIPLGWAVDEHGRPTTNPVVAAKGWGLPLGGYKGYGLALMVEVFSSILAGPAFGAQIGGLFTDATKPQDLGHFFGALDISGFMPLDEFRERMDALVDYVKCQPLDEGCDEILVPGEPEKRYAEAYRRDGIPLAEDVLETLNKLGRELGVAPLATR